MIEDFRELRVYQRAFEMATIVFEWSKEWPPEERYALTDQVRRSSRAICANIAEAWFKRSYPKHFTSKLSDASSEAAETLVWIDFAERCGYLDQETADALHNECRAILGGLVKMITQPQKWCSSARVREEPFPYDAEL